MLLLKSYLSDVLNKHLVFFIGYLTAFLAPIGSFIVAIEVLMLAEMVIGQIAARKSNTGEKYFWKKVLLNTALYIWTIMVLRVVETAFFKDEMIMSKIMAGYIVWNHFKLLVKNLGVVIGVDLWAQIESTINKIKL
jgi:hypothetical protein